jgi:hypothetical protein
MVGPLSVELGSISIGKLQYIKVVLDLCVFVFVVRCAIKFQDWPQIWRISHDKLLVRQREWKKIYYFDLLLPPQLGDRGSSPPPVLLYCIKVKKEITIRDSQLWDPLSILFLRLRRSLDWFSS